MRIIKQFYMFFRHPVLFFRYGYKKNVFVKGSIDLNNCRGIVLGNNIHFGYDCRLMCFKSNEDKIIIGDNCYFHNRDTLLGGGGIHIGENVLIASDVCISSQNHGNNPDSDQPYALQEQVLAPVSIGNGCWLAEKVMVLPGVSIGEKCIIGAGSVVVKDIPDYSIAVGNPAVVVKKYDYNKKEWVKISREENTEDIIWEKRL